MTAKSHSFLSSLLGVAGVLAIVTGCGDTGPHFADARGVVLLDGEPLEGAAVMYTPVSGGPVATGVTNSDGMFVLKTLEHDGAIVGHYRVAVTKQLMLGFDDSDPKRPGLIPIIEWKTPKRYALPETSKLTAKVGADAEQPSFELSSTAR